MEGFSEQEPQGIGGGALEGFSEQDKQPQGIGGGGALEGFSEQDKQPHLRTGEGHEKEWEKGFSEMGRRDLGRGGGGGCEVWWRWLGVILDHLAGEGEAEEDM